MEKVYYCPKCHAMFIDYISIENNESLEKSSFNDAEVKIGDTCKECKKKITSISKRKKRVYHLSKDYLTNYDDLKNINHTDKQKLIDIYIKQVVTNLYKQHKKYNIMKITHFQRKIIGEIINKIDSNDKNHVNIEITMEEFCVTYLKMGHDEYNEIRAKRCISHKLIKAISRALWFGCTTKQIMYIFRTSAKTINNVKKKDDKKYKNEMKIEGNMVKIQYIDPEFKLAKVKRYYRIQKYKNLIKPNCREPKEPKSIFDNN